MRCWRKARWCHGAGAGPRLAKSRRAWIVAGARSPPKRPGAGGGIKMMTSNPGSRRPRVPALVAGGLLLLGCGAAAAQVVQRSEEHTSELQSLMRISYAVFCLQKKN